MIVALLEPGRPVVRSLGRMSRSWLDGARIKSDEFWRGGNGRFSRQELGELVTFDADGRPSFNALHMHAPADTPLVLYAPS